MRTEKDIKKVRDILKELARLFSVPKISKKYKEQADLLDWVLGKNFNEGDN